MAFTLCFGAGAALTACLGGGTDSSSASTPASSSSSASVESSSSLAESSSEAESVSVAESSSSVEDSSVADSSDDVTPIENGYTFKVLKADGTPATGYQVQICLTGNTFACLMPIPVDGNGYANYPADKTKSYDIHMLTSDYQEVTGFQSMGTIPANYDGGVIVITLA